MWLKYPLLFVIFFIATLLQNSFLPAFNILGITPNLIFIVFFIVVFFEKNSTYVDGIFSLVVAGFMLDSFSPQAGGLSFGVSITSLLITYLLVKSVLKLLKERQDNLLFLYFVVLFLLSLSCYQLLAHMMVNFPHLGFSINRRFLLDLSYNVMPAFILFLIFAYITNPRPKDRQLKLFR